MKNLKKAELAVIALALLCLCFTAGYFVGRGTGAHIVSFEKLPASSAAPAAAPVMAADTPKSDCVPSAAVSKPALTSKLNINTASLTELEALPGIGEVLGQNIISYREKIGGFKTVEEIRDVDGIGEKKFAAIKDMITAG